MLLCFDFFLPICFIISYGITLSSSVAAGDTGNNFQVNSVTGLIELKKPVDFEGLSPNPIPLKVIAVDGGSSARTTTVAVDVTVTDVNDNVPVCTQAAYAVLMAENSAVGFTVRIHLLTTGACQWEWLSLSS